MLIREKLVINTAELGNKLPQLISLFRYENPEYYTKKSMKVSVKGIEPTLYHYALEDGPNGKQLILPRGAINKVKKFYNDNNIPFRILDKRIEHPTLIDWKMRSHSVEKGDPIILSNQQNQIIETLIKHEGGLIQASPGGGKSIAMMGLISQIKQPTLIIMHEHRLRSQWEAEIRDKVEGNFTLGRLDGDKKIEGDVVVGLFQTATKIIDEDPEWFNKFGMVIVDECLDQDTIISTPTGIKLLKDVQIGDEVLTPTGVAKVKNKWYTIKKAFKYITASSNYLIASKNHIVATYEKGFEEGRTNKRIDECAVLINKYKLPDQILFKKYVGKKKLIDIELDDENKIFIANDFLVHNCHHASAETYNKLITNTAAKYRVGITGTVKRSDGLELLIYDMFGPILIDISEKQLKERITKFEPLTQHTDIEFKLPTRRTYQNGVSDVAYDHTKTLNLICADEKRNTLILKNILKDIEEGYFPLVLSDRKEHCREIYNALTDMGIHSILLISDTRKSVKWEEVKSDTSVKCIVAIGKIASEGLDLPRLSSIHLTCPTTNESQIRQKIARVRRSFPDKPLPRVWDYVDNLAYYWRRNKDGEKVQSFKLKEQGVSRKRFYKKILDEYAEA